MSRVVPLKETPADKLVRRAAMQNSGQRLLEIITGIEELNERAAQIADDKKLRFAGAKSDGYDTKAIREVIRRRAQDDSAIAARRELEAVVDTYLAALEVVDES